MQAITDAIIQEDERLIVINKPAGVAVHGGSGVSFGVIEALRAARPEEKDSLELVHRLDRDTSGVLLVARKSSVLRTLHAQLREGHEFEKRYLALVKGSWNLGQKRIDAPLRTDLRVGGERTVRVQAGGKASVSDFRPVQFFGARATLLEVGILTGRTHQIRVHAAYAGHPVAGDDKYGDRAFNAEMQSLGLRRMFLHASSVSFTWPDRGTDFSVNAPLPADLGAVIDALAAATPKAPPRAAPPLNAARATDAMNGRSTAATQISGRPMRPVGSVESIRVISVSPRPSDLKPPAQSSDGSASTCRAISAADSSRNSQRVWSTCVVCRPASRPTIATAVWKIATWPDRLRQHLAVGRCRAGLAEHPLAEGADLVRADDQRAGMPHAATASALAQARRSANARGASPSARISSTAGPRRCRTATCSRVDQGPAVARGGREQYRPEGRRAGFSATETTG